MGQYHHPVCIEAEEGLNPHGMDSGLKEGEQGFNRPSTPAAIVALVCARGGNMPADCSQSSLIGRWAGKCVLIQGDYAEDDDIPGWKGPPLSLLYSAMTPVAEREKAERYLLPVFTDITSEACAFLEAACNVRYFESVQEIKDGNRGSKTYGQIVDRWTSVHSVRVRPLARQYGGCGVAEYVIDPSYDEEGLAYLKRCGVKPEDVQRPPRSVSIINITPCGITRRDVPDLGKLSEQHVGIEHIAIETDDYASALANFRKNGAQILEERVTNGRHVCWVAAPDGAQMELIEKV